MFLFLAALSLAAATQRHALEKRVFGWTPTQLHLSWTSRADEMTVTWVSWWEGSQTTVWYGPHGRGAPSQQATGSVTVFVDPGSPKKTTRFVHRATMTGLVAGQVYDYFVEDLTFAGVSATYSFRARNDSVLPQRFAMVGDFGVVNAESLTLLSQMAPHVDAIIHDGDFAYNLDDNDGAVGDAWFEMVEPIVAQTSLMTCPGNHESMQNFSHYRHRFSMPERARTENLYYSIDVGLVHFVALDLELYYFDTNATWLRMERWLQADLAAANQNRANVPWIIAFGHRPLYCTNVTDDFEDECTLKNNIQRQRLEDVFCKAGVDLVVGAHMHNYERTFPVYKEKVVAMPGDPYDDPPVPVFMVAGAAGCKERLDPFVTATHPWSAFKTSQYSIGQLTIHNSTALTWSQFLAAQPATAPPVDSFTLWRYNRQVPHPMCK